MRDYTQFYVDGKWITPHGQKLLSVINPATEAEAGKIVMGNEADVNFAVEAARRAFQTWSNTPKKERIKIITDFSRLYAERVTDVACAITEEMGAPMWLAEQYQAPAGLAHFIIGLTEFAKYELEEKKGTSRVVKEPIGVCGFITPWNWPMNQLTAKLAPALLAGCTVVHKPSEVAPLSSYILAQIAHDAGLPKGVYNMVNGDGPTVGAAIASHPKVDMISFTGSTRAGVSVAQAAAPTVKRVHQELGGKSPNIILDDANFELAVEAGVDAVMLNSGQSCNAPTRMLVPHSKMKQVARIAEKVTQNWKPGDPADNAKMGPVVSAAQWSKIQRLIQLGIDEGATLVTGGIGKPYDCEIGFFVKPTIFADVTNDMTIAQEEVFGPVLVIIGYHTEEDAIQIANDTPYGLAGYIYGENRNQIQNIAKQIRAGYITINAAQMDVTVPFGGYKMSGNGREFGTHAFDDFHELKSIVGYNKAGPLQNIKQSIAMWYVNKVMKIPFNPPPSN